MDTNSIASLASTISATAAADRVGIAVLKKALDIQAVNAAALLEALPPVPSINLPAHLGRNIDTSA
jgi:hypothetical protein